MHIYEGLSIKYNDDAIPFHTTLVSSCCNFPRRRTGGPTYWLERGTTQRHNQQCEKNEVVLGTPTASKTTGGPRVSPLGDRMTRKDVKGDQRNDGETTWTNTG